MIIHNVDSDSGLSLMSRLFRSCLPRGGVISVCTQAIWMAGGLLGAKAIHDPAF
jgi:hypothetical protein